MRSPQIMGVELPRSVSGTRQRTFSVRLHFSGRAFSGETPSKEGPRQLGQSKAFSPAVRQGRAQSVRLVMKGSYRSGGVERHVGANLCTTLVGYFRSKLTYSGQPERRAEARRQPRRADPTCA